jgi:Putative zinc binding domain
MTRTQTGLKLEDFEGSRFKWVDQIKQLMSSDLFGNELRWKSRLKSRRGQAREGTSMAKKNGRGCMFCGSPLRMTFVDLGMSPLCESYVSHEQLNQMEPFYPLHVYVCETCFLVQLHESACRSSAAGAFLVR